MKQILFSHVKERNFIKVYSKQMKDLQNMVYVRVRSVTIPQKYFFQITDQYEMVTFEKSKQYKDIAEKDKIIVTCYTKVAMSLCLELLDWCARYQDVKPNLFKGIQSQRKTIKSSKFGLSQRVLLRVKEACETKGIETPECLREILKLIQ